MRIAIVGGGSTYTPELIHGLATRAEALGLDEVALTDADPTRLDVVAGFCRRLAARHAPGLRVVTAPLEAAVEGAAFVVVQIRVGGQAARLEDERLGRDHAVIGQETTGVGGLAKALRTVPVVLDIAEVVARRAPEAWLIDFTNPVSIVSEALFRHADVRAVGLCNIPVSQRMEIAAHLGVAPADVALDSVGLNHLSFIRGVTVRGQDVLPRLVDEVSELLAGGHRPKNIPDLDFPAELLQTLQMIPSDYLRYYFCAPETVAEQRSQDELRAQAVMRIERALLDYYADPAHDTRPELLTQRGGAFYSHAALEIFEAMAAPEGADLVLDVPNDGAVPELPAGCSVEVPCRVRAGAVTPRPQRPLEPEIRGLIQHVKAYEELAVRAALSRARADVYRAVLTHPLTPDAETAGRLTDGVMARLR